MQLINNLNLTRVKRYIFIPIILGLILILFIAYSIITSLQRAKNQIQPYTPAVPQYEIKKLPQPEGFDQELAKVSDFLPYKGQDYVIEYLEANVILAKVSADSKESYFEAKKSAEEFFKSKGVKDLCVLKISWLIESDSLRKSLTPQEKYTSNCSRL